jgi:hypothetical protein
MIPLLPLLLAAPALEPPAQSPVELFKAACTQGSVALSRKSAAAIAYRDMPVAARTALGQAKAAGKRLGGPPRAGDVPGPVYALGPGNALFLLLPASGEGATGQFARSCAIVWKGEHFREARAAILPEGNVALAGETPEADPAGLASIGMATGDLYLTATTLRDWTVLKSAPRSEAPVP